MKIYLLQFFLLIGLGLNLQAQIPSNPIRGKVTCNGTGVPGVVVTDGIDCVLFIYPLLPDIYRKQNKQYLYSIRS